MSLLACGVRHSTQLKPKELVLETGPLDTWIIGYFTISTHNLAASSSLQLELPKLKSDEELNFEFLDQEGFLPSALKLAITLIRFGIILLCIKLGV